jgi:hypothetical protein
MAEKKRQHIIPNCYLKAWCDPNTPLEQNPYIWRISRDGSRKIKKSPEKSFTENDKYTIHLPDGTRNLAIEDTLGNIESQFPGVIERLRRREALKQEDKVRLCAFAAAMHTRTTAMGTHWKNQTQQLHDKIVELEKAHNATPLTSLETAEMVEHAHQHLIAEGIVAQVPLLYQMAMTILVTNDELGFITSDTPCVWFNPKLYKLPPFYRSPGLAQPDIEVTLPLTPQHLLVISHNRRLPPFVDVPAPGLTELNRRTRFHCLEEFVSCKDETRPEWFDEGTEPEDTWENSPEGRRAIEEQEAMKKWAEGGDRSPFAMPRHHQRKIRAAR